jgi:spore coat polysaccharide biosynthesis protein SpsF (cytidylyltransferase family)
MKSFSTEEVNRVIQRALLLKQRIGISREYLLEIGRELGLKSEVIEAALLQEMAEKSKETKD